MIRSRASSKALIFRSKASVYSVCFSLVKVDVALAGVLGVLLEKPFHGGLVAFLLFSQIARVFRDSSGRSCTPSMRNSTHLLSETPTGRAKFADRRAVTAGDRPASWTELYAAEGGHVIAKDGLVELNAERGYDVFGCAVLVPAVGKVLEVDCDGEGRCRMLVITLTLKSRTFPGTLRLRNCSGGAGREAMTALLMSREILAFVLLFFLLPEIGMV